MTVCGFCKGQPVGNAATWVDGKPRPPAPCPRCGEIWQRLPIICECCLKGPHHDGYPPIWSVSEAIDLGWSRTATGVLDEECASDILSNSVSEGWR